MKKTLIPFISFLILLFLTVPFSFNFASSVVSGWHTTLFPPYYIWTMIVVIFLLFIIIGYCLLARRVGKINWTLYGIHFILSIVSVIFLKLPWIFLEFKGNYNEQFLNDVSWRLKLMPIAWTLFIAGQIIFLIYYIRIISTNHVVS